MSLLSVSGTKTDEDKYTLLVSLILWWFRGCRSGVLVSYLVLVRRLGPTLDTEVLPLKTKQRQ